MYIAAAFKFNPTMFVAEVFEDFDTEEIKTMFFPNIHYKSIEIRTIRMNHEENREEGSNAPTPDRNN